MPVQPIRLFGDPVLRTPAAPVTDFDKELRRLVEDLTDTMRDAPGAGLAAPQIGVGLRVFTWDVEGELGHLVNPVLDLSEEEQLGPEGCLSLPGLSLDCRRAMRAVAKGFDMHGEPVTIEGHELLARALQHETDHLDGVLDRGGPTPRREQREVQVDPAVRRDGERAARQHRAVRDHRAAVGSQGSELGLEHRLAGVARGENGHAELVSAAGHR